MPKPLNNNVLPLKKRFLYALDTVLNYKKTIPLKRIVWINIYEKYLLGQRENC